MHTGRILLFVVAAIVAILVGLGIGYRTFGRPGSAPKTAALLLRPPKSLPAFSLVDDRGVPFTRASLGGHWSLLYFGYTHCTDICPATLADLNQMAGELADLPAAERPQVYFISLDPKRDTPALLVRYVRHFNPAFTGVTGTVADLRALTAPLGVAFSYDPPDQSGNYTVDHSSVVFLINPANREAAIYTPPMISGRMAADYRAIIKYYGER